MPPVGSLDNVPHIASSTYTGTAYGLGAQGLGQTMCTAGASTGTDDWGQLTGVSAAKAPRFLLQAQAEEIDMATSTNRFVRVLIVDPNENIPLDKRMVYKGEEKFTDSSDTELYFEIDIKGVLDAHNAERIKIVDKKVKERTEYLEPAKIRDLKMVVVNIASF